MVRFEYKVVPAPVKGRKVRGVRRSEDKFAYSVQEVMNEMALDGWEYQRSETLPHEERSGLTSTSTTFRSILVFRRAIGTTQSEPTPQVVEVAEPVETPAASPVTEHISEAEPEASQSKAITPKRVRPTQVVEVDEDDGFFAASPTTPPQPGTGSLPAALRQRATQKRSQKDIAAE